MYMHLPLLAQQFTVRPESVVQAEGLEAVFECLNTGAVLHAWGLNGEFPPEDQFPFDLIRLPPSGDTPARLIIPATPQYNNTVVQCRAVTLLDGNKLGSVFSDNATLEVQGNSNCVLVWESMHYVLNKHSL